MAPTNADPDAHPERLATVGTLHALSAPDPRTSRVLELGCGTGGNLLAIAVAAPAVRALGVEPAAEPVAEGNRVIAEIGLANVELRQVDVSELTDGRLGEFDYVIARGLLAGEPDAVLAACHSHLAADGLAHVTHDARGPVRLAELADRAAGHGLAYVGDGGLSELVPGRVRRSVLCRDSRTAATEPDAAAVRRLCFAARGDGVTEPAAGGHELLASALALLRARAPDTTGFGELRAALGAEPDALAEAMLAGLQARLVMPHSAPLRAVAATDVARPAASPLARWQARRGPEVTSLAHTSVRIQEPAARRLLTLLDGTRDRAAIRAELAERTGVRLSAGDLDANLERLGRLFLLSEGV